MLLAFFFTRDMDTRENLGEFSDYSRELPQTIEIEMGATNSRRVS